MTRHDRKLTSAFHKGVGGDLASGRLNKMERLQVRLGVQPLIFTAPHAIYLHRDDHPVNSHGAVVDQPLGLTAAALPSPGEQL